MNDPMAPDNYSFEGSERLAKRVIEKRVEEVEKRHVL